MATGGGEDACVDSRVVCSVCLEPYRGRQPKLLPCFHTFCLPCLTQLAGGDTQQVIASDVSGDTGDRKEDGATVSTITCPTCRKVSPVPLGGVAQFQANFYVDEGDKQDSAPPVCDLCDEGQSSTSFCSKCETRSCSRCIRLHDKICKPPKTKMTENRVSFTGDDFMQKARNQLRVMETALTRLGEEEGEMERERRAMEDSINVRYAAGLGTMADARDECLVSLRETIQVTRASLQGEITAIRTSHERLSRLLPPDGISAKSASSSQLQAALVSDEEFERLEQRVGKGGGAGFFEHTTMEDSRESAVNFHRVYMGKVVPAKVQNNNGSTATSKAEDGALDRNNTQQIVTDTDRQTNSSRELSDFQNQMKIRLGELLWEINTLKNKQVESESLTSTLQSEKASLRRDLTSVRAELSGELASLKREHNAWKDKCSLLCQDVASLQADNSKTRQDLTTVQADTTKLSQDLRTVQTDTTKLRQDLATVQTDNTKLRQDLATVQTDNRKLRQDLTTVQTDITKLHQDLTRLSSVQTDIAKTATGVSALQKNLDDLRKTAKADTSKMSSDLDSAQKDIGRLKTRVSTVETASRKFERLEKEMAKAKQMVCFHASPTKEITTSGEKILVMDNVTYNVGNGYSPQTGIFTAPVSGIYIFMATSTPANEGTHSSLSIVVQDKSLVMSYNKVYDSCGTCHAAVRLSARQTVCVKSFPYDSSSFNGGINTCFSGVLVQPEI